MIKCVTFDFTGTLAQFARAPASVYFERLRVHLPALREDAMRRSFKSALKAQSIEREHFGGAQQLSSMQWWQPVIDNAVNAALDAAEASTDQVESSRRAWREHAETLSSDLLTYFTTSDAYRVCPSVVECLHGLRAMRMPLGVLSNNDTRLHLILDNLQLSSYFQFVITSHETAASKPSAKIFQTAVERAGVANAKQVLHVGDDTEKDRDGALAIGMRAILLQPEAEKKEIDAAVDELHTSRWTTLSSLESLPILIQQFNKRQ